MSKRIPPLYGEERRPGPEWEQELAAATSVEEVNSIVAKFKASKLAKAGPLSGAFGNKKKRNKKQVKQLKQTRGYKEPRPALGDKKKRKRKKAKSERPVLRAGKKPIAKADEPVDIEKHPHHKSPQDGHGNWARGGAVKTTGAPDYIPLEDAKSKKAGGKKGSKPKSKATPEKKPAAKKPAPKKAPAKKKPAPKAKSPQPVKVKPRKPKAAKPLSRPSYHSWLEGESATDAIDFMIVNAGDSGKYRLEHNDNVVELLAEGSDLTIQFEWSESEEAYATTVYDWSDDGMGKFADVTALDPTDATPASELKGWIDVVFNEQTPEALAYAEKYGAFGEYEFDGVPILDQRARSIKRGEGIKLVEADTPGEGQEIMDRWVDPLEPPSSEVKAIFDAMPDPDTDTLGSSVKYYTGGSYDHINGYLRTAAVKPMDLGNPDTKQWKEFTEPIVENIVSSAVPLPRDVTLYRGFNGGPFRASKPGDPMALMTPKEIIARGTFSDPALMSTSLSPSTASGFGRTIVAIKAPKGTPAVDVVNEDESEIVLLPNTQWRVTGVTEVEGTDRRVVWAEIVPTVEKAAPSKLRSVKKPSAKQAKKIPIADRWESEDEWPTKKSIVKHYGPGPHKSGTPQSVHGSWSRGLSAPQIAEELRTTEGFTIHYPTGVHPREGWSVSLGQWESKTPLKEMNESWVRKVKRTYEVPLRRDDTSLGGWIEENEDGVVEAWLEVSKPVMSFSEALELGRSTKQIAIFNLGTFEYLYLSNQERIDELLAEESGPVDIAARFIKPPEEEL